MTLRELLSELVQAAQEGDGARIGEILVDALLDAEVGSLVEVGGWIVAVAVTITVGRWIFDFGLALAEGDRPDTGRENRATRAGRALHRRVREQIPPPDRD